MDFLQVAGDLINNECANALADVGGLRVRATGLGKQELEQVDGRLVTTSFPTLRLQVVRRKRHNRIM